MTPPPNLTAFRERAKALRHRATLLDQRLVVAEAFMRALAAAGVPSEPKPYHSEAPSWEWFRSREQRSHSDRMWLRVRFDLVGGLTLQWAKTSTAYFGLAEDGLLAVDDGGEMALPARFVALARGIALAEGDLDACSHEARP